MSLSRSILNDLVPYVHVCVYVYMFSTKPLPNKEVAQYSNNRSVPSSMSELLDSHASLHSSPPQENAMEYRQDTIISRRLAALSLRATHDVRHAQCQHTINMHPGAHALFHPRQATMDPKTDSPLDPIPRIKSVEQYKDAHPFKVRIKLGSHPSSLPSAFLSHFFLLFCVCVVHAEVKD